MGDPCTISRRLRVGDWSRFDRHVQRGEGCWNWTGPVDADGYARFHFGGGSSPAARAAWQFHYDTVLESRLLIRRKCRSRLCVRPDHHALTSRLMLEREQVGDSAQTEALRAACRTLRKLGGHSAARTGSILGLTADRVYELCRETADEARRRVRGTT